MSNAQIIEKCTVKDFSVTKDSYVEIKAVRFYSAALANKLERERDEARNSDPFEGTIFAR